MNESEALLLNRRELMQQIISHPDALADLLSEVFFANWPTTPGFEVDVLKAQIAHLQTHLKIDPVKSTRREHT